MKKLGNRGYNHKIADRNAFIEFAKKHGGKTHLEMANLWGNISQQTIHRALQKSDLQEKKTYGYKERSEFAESVGAEILYLPHYSPDFNEIEHHWFAIKNRARKNIPIFKSFRLAVDSAFL